MGERKTNSEERLDRVAASFWEVSPRKGLFFLGVLGVGLAILSLIYVWLHVQQVQSSYHLARLYSQHEQLVETQRKLRLEWARLGDPYLLEELGRERFGLKFPEKARRFMLQDGADP